MRAWKKQNVKHVTQNLKIVHFSYGFKNVNQKKKVIRMFTKQHYIAIAEVIGKAENLEDLEKRIIELFRDDNERFDNWRFSAYIKDIRDANKPKTKNVKQ